MPLRFLLNDGTPVVNPCVLDAFGSDFPVHNFTRITGCPRPGIAVEVIRELCVMLGESCWATYRPGLEYGNNVSGAWGGVMAELLRGAFDASGPMTGLTAGRSAVATFTDAVFVTRLLLLTRFPRQAAFSFGDIMAFKAEVWAAILASMLLLGCLGALVTRVRSGRWGGGRASTKNRSEPSRKLGSSNRPDMGRWRRVGRLGWAVGSKTLEVGPLILQQGISNEHPGSFLVSLGIWGLCCVVLIGTYSSFILVSALNTGAPPPFHDYLSFAQCLEAKKCHLHLQSAEDSIMAKIEESTAGDPANFRTRQALYDNPLRVANLTTILSRILSAPSGQYITTMYPHPGMPRVLNDSKEPCSFYAVTAYMERTAFALTKGSKWKEKFNVAIRALQETGVAQRIYDTYLHEALAEEYSCSLRQLSAEPMKIWNYMGAIVSFSFGVFVASAAFLCELLGRCKKS